MILYIRNTNTIDSITTIKSSGKLNHYLFIEKYYSGNVDYSTTELLNTILSDLMGIMQIDKEAIVVFNNIDLALNMAKNNNKKEELKLFIEINNKLKEMGHRVITNVTETQAVSYDIMKDINDVEFTPSVIALMKSIVDEGLNEYDVNDNLYDPDEIIDELAQLES